MASTFKAAMNKLQLLGQNKATLIDCSDVSPCSWVTLVVIFWHNIPSGNSYSCSFLWTHQVPSQLFKEGCSDCCACLSSFLFVTSDIWFSHFIPFSALNSHSQALPLLRDPLQPCLLCECNYLANGRKNYPNSLSLYTVHLLDRSRPAMSTKFYCAHIT